jgi:F-type H+-transporting ATPase subunit gamma
MSLEQVQHQRQAVANIHDVVSAMRAISAGRIQGAQRTLESVRLYHAAVLRAAGIVLADWSPPNHRKTEFPLGLLVMTSEQPLCGPLTQNIVRLAERRYRELAEQGEVRLLVVGRRGVRQVQADRLPIEAAEPAITSLHGARDLVKRLAERLAGQYASGELRTVRVLYNRYQSITEQVPTEEPILPPDFSALVESGGHSAGRFYQYLPPAELLRGIIAEYMFIALYRITGEMFASEQASRMVAMDAATRSSERMLDDLSAQENRERQHQITQQVLELIAGHLAASRR